MATETGPVLRLNVSLVFLMAVSILLRPVSAGAEGLIVDLSSHHVAITTGFTGTDVLLFGTVDGEGDIVVVITGPPESVVVRHKRRVAGIWANAESVTFDGVPNFYVVASTRPLSGIATEDVRREREIGVGNIGLVPAPGRMDRSSEELKPFREALIRNKQRAGLYSREPEKVSIIGNRLFRTSIHFPADMATGSYTAMVYQLNDQGVVHARSAPLQVEKVGLGARVYDIAHRESALYGICAILVAVAAGWFSGFVFRKI